MPVTKILIRLTTLDASQGSTGTSDPLYLGVETKNGGREFPLRYQRSGLSIGVGQTLEFGINASDLPPEKQIYNSTGEGANSIAAFPLNTVERVYLRKQPVSAGSDRDDTFGVYYVAAFITEVNNGVTSVKDWSNRNRPDSSGPSPFWLGNEYGQIVYLAPEVAS